MWDGATFLTFQVTFLCFACGGWFFLRPQKPGNEFKISSSASSSDGPLGARHLLGWQVVSQCFHPILCTSVSQPFYLNTHPKQMPFIHPNTRIICPTPLLLLKSDRTIQKFDPVGWSCRIHWLHLCRGVWLPNDCPWYDTKQSDGKARSMWSTTSLPSLPDPLWPRVVAPDSVRSMGQIELFDI